MSNVFDEHHKDIALTLGSVVCARIYLFPFEGQGYEGSNSVRAGVRARVRVMRGKER